MIVVEGVYANSGDVAPLQQLYKLKEEYKYRLCVEESHAFGVLGQTGRGACEAAGLQPGQVGWRLCCCWQKRMSWFVCNVAHFYLKLFTVVTIKSVAL